eukprot:scpid20528/ scgid7027/ 
MGQSLFQSNRFFSEPASEPLPSVPTTPPKSAGSRRTRRSVVPTVAPDQQAKDNDFTQLPPASSTPVKLVADSPSRVGGLPASSAAKQKKSARTTTRTSSKLPVPTVAGVSSLSSAIAPAPTGSRSSRSSSTSGGASSSSIMSSSTASSTSIINSSGVIAPQMRMTLRRRNADNIKPVPHKK